MSRSYWLKDWFSKTSNVLPPSRGTRRDAPWNLRHRHSCALRGRMKTERVRYYNKNLLNTNNKNRNDASRQF